MRAAVVAVRIHLFMSRPPVCRSQQGRYEGLFEHEYRARADPRNSRSLVFVKERGL